ncbi:MAG: hypothetical protein AAGB51_13755 [Planctomycetota bacterium]
MQQPLKTLTEGLIDYAGLFPPAKLPIEKSVESYARHLQSEHRQVLGRFICAVGHLEGLTEHGRALMPGTWATSGYREMADQSEPWFVSVVLPHDIEQLPASLDAIGAFNERHAEETGGLARVDSVELRVSEPTDVDLALDRIPEELMPHFEVPVMDTDCRGFVAAIAGTGAAAKVRCGGVTPDLFPTTEDLAAFLKACLLGEVPFKATAGLHHPIRAEYRLTYEENPPTGIMHGFLNVFVAATLMHAGELEPDGVQPVLAETDPEAFIVTRDGLGWRGATVNASAVMEARRFALGYGSCSFDEPIEDLGKLGLL